MSKQQEELTSDLYLKDEALFYQAFQKAAANRESMKSFLDDLLTESEIIMLKRRWHIARLLLENRTIREVARLASVGTDTVNRVSKSIRFGSGVLQNIIESFGTGQAPKKDRDIKLPWILGDTSENDK